MSFLLVLLLLLFWLYFYWCDRCLALSPWLYVLQATEVLKIILGRGNVLCGRILVYDALKMSFSESRLAKTQVGGI